MTHLRQLSAVAFAGVALCSPPLTFAQADLAAKRAVPAPVTLPPGHKTDSLLTRWMEPTYPRDALAKSVVGSVTLEFDIDKQGRPVSPAIVDANPPGVFDAAVLQTIQYWTIFPYLASRCFRSFPRSRITVDFRIEDGKPLVYASRPLPLSDPSQVVKSDKNPALESTEIAPPPKKPKLRWQYTTEPRYPMRSAGREPIYANVVLAITIEPDGTVGKTEVLFSSPYAEFGEAAVAATPNWKAVTLEGKPPGVQVTLCQPLSFRPEGSE